MRHVFLAALLAVVVAADSIGVSVRARAIRPGELVALTITTPVHVDRLRVRAFGREAGVFPIEARKWTALVGIDLDVDPGRYPVTIDGGAPALQSTYDLVVEPRRFGTRELTVDPAFVNPPDSERGRIEREAKLLEDVWAARGTERLWEAPFVRPVPHPANSRFGARSIVNGVPLNRHGGADFLSPPGARVRAPNAGRIVVGRPLYFSGNTVVIDHGLGLFSMLAHLSVVDVAEGDRVEAGAVVGRVGATGRVTGPHLHWAVRAAGARVDPLSVLAVLGTRRATIRRGD